MNTNLKTGYYQADTISGVTYLGETIDDKTIDVLLPTDFQNYLSTCEDNDIFVAYFSEDDLPILSEINEEYWVRNYY